MASSPFEQIGRPRHPDVLTPAEWEVLAGVRDHLSNADIAARRECSVETVRFHLRNVRRKLQVTTRDGLRAFPGRPAADVAAARRPIPAIREQIPLVAVHHMTKSLAFYVDALGFRVISRWPGDEDPPGWAALGSGGARVMLHQGHHRRRVEQSRRAGTVTISLYVEGLDAFRRNLVRAGVRCSDPKSLFYGAREFYLQDPDGNELAIVEFAASEPKYLATKRRKSR